MKMKKKKKMKSNTGLWYYRPWYYRMDTGFRVRRPTRAYSLAISTLSLFDLIAILQQCVTAGWI